MKTRNIAIMLTDIKGFTSKTAGFSRAQTQELLNTHRELVLPVIEKFNGRLVKTIGDAFLVAFDSPTDAVLCGVRVQDVLKDHNSGKADKEKIEIRIAINAGEVSIHDDGDIYGDPVNITSRLESIAEAGEVFFTEAVYLAMNKTEVPSSEIGYRQFKGVAEKVKVYRVLREVPVGKLASEAGPAAPGIAAASSGAIPEKVGGTAGFWRRLTALLLDALIFSMLLNMLLAFSCGPVLRAKRANIQNGQDMGGETVELSPGNVNVRIQNGKISVVGNDGQVLVDTAQDNKRVNSVSVNTGANRKKMPLKLLLWALYCAVTVWRFGATPGKMILKLKVVDFSTSGVLPADRSFLRAFFSIISLSAIFIGYAWALREKDGRTWHDLIAGSKVVRV